MARKWDEPAALELVRRVVSQALRRGAGAPGDQDDLVKAGLVDSMDWVGILSSLEEASGIPNFGSVWPDDRRASIRGLADLLLESAPPQAQGANEPFSLQPAGVGTAVALTGWGSALGSRKLGAEERERDCGLAPGTLLHRAGIESVCTAADDETELTLGLKAAESALSRTNALPEHVDFIIATSATFLAFPSLAASLHSLLLLPESCGALDIGGACVGLIQALAAAKALLGGSPHGVALVVAAEVHSRRLDSAGVPGDFRGLFGDGACAFVLARGAESRAAANGAARPAWNVGDFVWGCSGSSASSLRVSVGASGATTGQVQAEFKGDQLAGAAVSTLERALTRLEYLSGRPRSEVGWFALHQPNPRVVEILARRAGIPMAKIPPVSKAAGNLGSVTCGVSLCAALDAALSAAGAETHPRPPIFMAAVGPGLLWGGVYFQ